MRGRILAFGAGRTFVRGEEEGRGRWGFSAVRDIYFTSILIASVGREDDCGGPDVPSGSTIYSTLTYERKREPFKTRWCIREPDSGPSSFAVAARQPRQAGRQAWIVVFVVLGMDARLRRRME